MAVATPRLEALGLAVPLPPPVPDVSSAEAEVKERVLKAAKRDHEIWREDTRRVQKMYQQRFAIWRREELASSARQARSVRHEACAICAAVLFLAFAPNATASAAVGGAALTLFLHATCAEPRCDADVLFKMSFVLRRVIIFASLGLPQLVWGGRWRTTGGVDSGIMLRRVALAKPLQGLSVAAVIVFTFLQSSFMPVPAVVAMPSLNKFLHHLSRSLCVTTGLIWAMQAAVVAGAPPQDIMLRMAGYAIFYGGIVMLGSSKSLEKIDGLDLPDNRSGDMDHGLSTPLMIRTPESSQPPSVAPSVRG
jgi:hypothetical protein